LKRRKNRETGERLKSCTVIVTEPNKFAAEIHDRMPVVLTEDQFVPWLSGEAVRVPNEVRRNTGFRQGPSGRYAKNKERYAKNGSGRSRRYSCLAGNPYWNSFNELAMVCATPQASGMPTKLQARISCQIGAPF
jgi:hypothetical protein